MKLLYESEFVEFSNICLLNYFIFLTFFKYRLFFGRVSGEENKFLRENLSVKFIRKTRIGIIGKFCEQKPTSTFRKNCSFTARVLDKILIEESNKILVLFMDDWRVRRQKLVARLFDLIFFFLFLVRYLYNT